MKYTHKLEDVTPIILYIAECIRKNLLRYGAFIFFFSLFRLCI